MGYIWLKTQQLLCQPPCYGSWNLSRKKKSQFFNNRFSIFWLESRFQTLVFHYLCSWETWFSVLTLTNIKNFLLGIFCCTRKKSLIPLERALIFFKLIFHFYGKNEILNVIFLCCIEFFFQFWLRQT